MATPSTTKAEQSPSARFTEMVLKEYQASTGQNSFSPDQSRRVQNYFVKMDMVLSESETKRLSKPESSRDPLEFAWKNINLERFTQDVAIFAQLGLDPMMPNHINLILYKNGRTNKFDVGFIRGYKGLEIVARNFGVNPPIEVITELVYSNDEYVPIKKDMEHEVETYKFKIGNPFSRGELQGGFIYMRYADPKLNSIESLSVVEIEKRKPKYASPEFWGGEKTTYKNGKPDGKETIEGWYTEMCIKTLKRKAWNSVTIDGSKINTAFEKMAATENQHETNLTVDAVATVVEETPKTISMNQNSETLKNAAQQMEAVPVHKIEPEQPAQSASLDFPESK